MGVNPLWFRQTAININDKNYVRKKIKRWFFNQKKQENILKKPQRIVKKYKKVDITLAVNMLKHLAYSSGIAISDYLLNKQSPDMISRNKFTTLSCSYFGLQQPSANDKKILDIHDTRLIFRYIYIYISFKYMFNCFKKVLNF